MSYLYILEINLLPVALFANIFSRSEGCLFILFTVSFAVQKLLNLIRSYFFHFIFISITLDGRSKRILLWFYGKKCSAYVFSKSFIFSGLTFRSLIYLSLFLCLILVSALISFIYMWLSSFPSTSYWSGYLFSIVYSCLFCQR